MKKTLTFIFLSILFLIFMTACGSSNEKTKEAANNTPETETAGETANEEKEVQVEEEPAEIIISAAASLTDVAEEIKTAFNKQHPNITISYNFGSSGKLSQQIKEGGAPVDIFMSASKKDMDFLSENQLLVEETRFDFASNKIVIIAPESSDIVLEKIEDLATVAAENIAIGDIEATPLGRYGKQALEKLSVWDKVEGKMVFASTVNQVLTYVQQGNAELGISFSTDALRAEGVKVIANIDPSLHDAVIYPAAALNTSENLDAAKAYLDFLKSEEGKGILESHGFITN